MSESTVIEQYSPDSLLKDESTGIKKWRLLQDLSSYIGQSMEFRNEAHGAPLDAEEFIRTGIGEEQHEEDRSAISSSWFIFPLDGSLQKVWIGNREGGFLTYYTSWGVNFASAENAKENDERFIWKIESSGEGNTYRIRNQYTFTYLRMSDKNSTVYLGEKSSSGDDLWRMRPTQLYSSPAVKNLKKAPNDPDYGDPDPLNSLKEPRERTGLRLVGEVALPFSVVDDNDRTAAWKARYSPYYVLRRFSQWKRAGWTVYDGRSDTEHSVTIDYGVSQSTSRTIEKQLGISVTADAGFAFKGVSAAISATVSANLSISTTTNWVESYSKSVTHNQFFPENSGIPYGVADWERRDIYTISRAENGSSTAEDKILEWEVTVPRVHVSYSYPP